ncbi:MAG: DUF4399 domain-containing protein [Gammaproteobacteria bacterium]|jgi:hypothetical protein|nr:DUF4399 domain-containing protein [Gammaproteobacteria bacterium]MBT6754482.1 DUF4399 domain-containing protein [Gammaproteobacteria bacterium]MBT7522898.1 DUF4399 domain-containing protein [Gammaproteobacteria bacterium]MBT7814635.1 DUF4399 domain-containing protein [Gammaproteobacteria bacterium]MDC3386476.1 DUF4399 domain-containing protein [Gammaproteobacteria bacterium]|tara:strand:- start:1957 stop:2373 length:417 start_codon:yes stop_codon:yes gene_type:complete
MFKIKKIIYFIFLLSITSLSYSGNNEEKSIKLEGVENGKTYSSPIKLNFIIKNMRVLKAGVNEKNSGHHHLLINLKDLPDLKLSLPMTKNIIHFGKGQTSTNLKLKPGKHTIQLLFADYSHTPHEKPLITDKITFFIK